MIATHWNSLYQRVHDYYRASTLPDFFHWWRTELKSLLPARWRQTLEMRPPSLALLTKDGELYCYRHEGAGYHLLQQWPLQAEPADNDVDLSVLAAPLLREGGRVDGILTPLQALIVPLTLPLAAAENIRQVLQFEMDRLTPFKAEDVYYDYQLQQRDKQANTLKLQLIVSPRRIVDPLVNALEGRGIRLNGIDVLVDALKDIDSIHTAGVNLLPINRRQPVSRKSLWRTLALSAAASLLVVVTLNQSLAAKRQAIVELTQQVNQLRQQALQVAEQRKTLDQTLAASQFLVRQKHQASVISERLWQLTQLLPDHTFLEQWYLVDDELILQGQSADASSLIALLAATEGLEEVGFQSPVTQNRQTGKENFKLKMRLIEQDCCGPVVEKVTGKVVEEVVEEDRREANDATATQ